MSFGRSVSRTSLCPLLGAPISDIVHSRWLCVVMVPTLVAMLLPIVLATPASAGQRVALVIGNASYAHAPSLENPLNDATDIGASLERLGFAVTILENAGKSAFERGLQTFARAAETSDIAVVFYAGHGIEIDQRNFLIPSDARLASDRDVEFEAVPLDLVSRAVEPARELRLIILDACRDNPFAAAMKRSGATRSIGRGLARVEPAGETLVAYAAKGGSVAADGEGRNSPFTTALLAHLEESGLEVGLMFRKVRDSVLSTTGGRQEPFVYGSLSSKGFYLAALHEPVPTNPGTPTAGGGSIVKSDEQLFWESVRGTRDPADLEAYLEAFPEGAFAALARNRLARLSDPQARPTDDAEAMEASLRLGRDERRHIQEGLAALGFDPGQPDGLFGRRTRTAIGDWQSSRGGSATGHLDAEAAKMLLAAGEEAARKRAAEEKERRRAEEEAARKQAALRPGHVFRDCPECPEMVVVPAGSFTMGSPSSEEGRDDDEGPQHRVTIAAPFAVGKYEVTRAEFARFVEATGHSTGNACWTYERKEWENRSGRGWRNPGYQQDEHHPAVCVSWEDAKWYVHWLSRKTAERYRLLSEAEWEYAARAGTRTSRYWGDDVSAQCVHANGYDRTAKAELDYSLKHAPCRDGSVHTARVGRYGANGFGLHDVLGNVWEWVEDCWHGSYAGAPADGSAWGSGGDCVRRVFRGGSLNSDPRVLRSAIRVRNPIGIRGYDLGFRVSRTLTP